MSDDHRFTIGGEPWTWRYSRLRGNADGWTYGRPTHRVIIDKRLRGQRRLEVEVHELLHALFPDLSEESVTAGAADMRRVLWHLGYRLTEQE